MIFWRAPSKTWQRGVRPNTQEQNTHSKKGEHSLKELGVSCQNEMLTSELQDPPAKNEESGPENENLTLEFRKWLLAVELVLQRNTVNLNFDFWKGSITTRCLFEFKQTVHRTRNSSACPRLKKVLLWEVPPCNFSLGPDDVINDVISITQLVNRPKLVQPSRTPVNRQPYPDDMTTCLRESLTFVVMSSFLCIVGTCERHVDVMLSKTKIKA